jgi:hypothetical protein
MLQSEGTDAEVQREETRLVDLEALSQLRGGLGESYRATIQAILADRTGGLVFPDLVAAVRARQGHEVHRGTIRAILSAGGFVCREGRWHIAAQPEEGERQFRRALVETLVPTDRVPDLHGRPGDPQRLRAVAQAIWSRLREIIGD